MRTNVFLRSMRRQPAKAAVMLLVIGIMTFAFVSRAAEYLIISHETERLSGYYTSVGSLESTGGGLSDRDEAAALLSQHPDVELVNRYRNVSAVLQEDFTNADFDMALTSGTTQYYAFSGTLLIKSRSFLSFIMDTPLTGYSDVSLVFRSGSIHVGRIALLMYNNLGYSEEAFADIKKGDRFFVVGRYDTSDHNCTITHDGGLYLNLVPVTDDAPVYPLPEGEDVDLNDPALARWKELIPFVQDQQRAVNALAVEDMSALPGVQEDNRYIYLTDGRWLDSADTQEGRRVCVINNGFASAQNLKVGDTLTLKLRDVPSYFGYCLAPTMEETIELWRGAKTAEAETFEIVGTYEYVEGNKHTHTILRNNLYIPSSVVPEGFVCANGSGLDEMAYAALSAQAHTTELYYEGAEGPYPGETAFILKDPAAEASFVADTREALGTLGFRTVMVENGWSDFQAAAVPMRRSSLYNAVIFTVVLVAALVLVTFAYFFMRRKELAVVRAMGLPANRCAAEISLPLLIVGFLGLLPGALFGWRYAEQSAGETLESLAAFGSDGAATLPWAYLAALCGIVAVLLVAVVLIFAHVRARLPVLRQIQGGAPAGAKKKALGKSETVPVPAVAAAVDAAAVRPSAVRTVPAVSDAPATGKGSGTGVVLRFVWRHMARAWAKSLLTALLAAAFTVGLSAISLSIETNTQKIEELYETISVRVELTQKDSTSMTVPGGGFLFEEAVQSVLDTGYITDAYLEGANIGSLYTYDAMWDAGKGIAIMGEGDTCNIRAVDNLEKFLSAIGSGSAWTITYEDGWDESCFGRDWREAGQTLEGDDMLPLLLPRVYYDQYMAEGAQPIILTCRGQHRACQVIGVYDKDNAQGGDFQTMPLVLMPQSALQAMVGNKMRYSWAIFTVDPAMNYDLDAFRESIDELANTPHIGGVPVRVILRDEELRQAAEPLEESVTLMEILYPVMLVLSVLVAAAGSALFVMLSAKDAAILRVQGTGKARVQLMLSLQQVFTSFAGLLAGLTSMAVYLAGRHPELTGTIFGGALLCAVLYLAAATTGAVGASVAVTGRNPLEMLQVKE